MSKYYKIYKVNESSQEELLNIRHIKEAEIESKLNEYGLEIYHLFEYDKTGLDFKIVLAYGFTLTCYLDAEYVWVYHLWFNPHSKDYRSDLKKLYSNHITYDDLEGVLKYTVKAIKDVKNATENKNENITFKNSEIEQEHIKEKGQYWWPKHIIDSETNKGKTYQEIETNNQNRVSDWLNDKTSHIEEICALNALEISDITYRENIIKVFFNDFFLLKAIWVTTLSHWYYELEKMKGVEYEPLYGSENLNDTIKKVKKMISKQNESLDASIFMDMLFEITDSSIESEFQKNTNEIESILNESGIEIKKTWISNNVARYYLTVPKGFKHIDHYYKNLVDTENIVFTASLLVSKHDVGWFYDILFTINPIHDIPSRNQTTVIGFDENLNLALKFIKKIMKDNQSLNEDIEETEGYESMIFEKQLEVEAELNVRGIEIKKSETYYKWFKLIFKNGYMLNVEHSGNWYYSLGHHNVDGTIIIDFESDNIEEIIKKVKSLPE